MTYLYRIKKFNPLLSLVEILAFLRTLCMLIYISVPFPEVVEPEPPVSSLCGLTWWTRNGHYFLGTVNIYTDLSACSFYLQIMASYKQRETFLSHHTLLKTCIKGRVHLGKQLNRDTLSRALILSVHVVYI